MSDTFVAVLLMAGKGMRFESSLPKQLHHIAGKPIFLYTLEVFLQLPIWEKIILVSPLSCLKAVETIILALPLRDKIQIISGGETRQQSCYLALRACPQETDYVVIHDGVRPFVSQKILENNITAVRKYKAVDTCIPSADTIVHVDRDDWIKTIPIRNEFLRGQTPQSFSYPLLLEAHEQAIQQGTENSSDDCRLVLQMGHAVKIIPGEERNIKITTELDLFLAEKLLSQSVESIPGKGVRQDLKGKIFVITGATGGIGKAICQKLTEVGAIPIEVSKTAPIFKADLTKNKETEAVFSAIYKQYGPLDGLINSLGTFIKQDLQLLSEEEIQETIASNFTSIIYCCKWAKLKEGGHIINISSSSYSRGRKDYPIYSAVKAAVVNLTQGLAEAHPEFHINVVVPQRTNTPLRRNNFPEESTENLLKPEEIAVKILALLQEKSMTGTIIEVRKQYPISKSTDNS